VVSHRYGGYAPQHIKNQRGDTTKRIFIGIDVSKDKFDVGVKDEQNRTVLMGKTYPMNRIGLDQFKEEMDKVISELKAIPVYGLEASGIYHLPLYEYLRGFDVDLHLLNPLEIKKKDQRKVRKTKTDKLDAVFIAEALMLRHLEHHQYRPSGKVAELREYCRIRNRLMEKSKVCKIQARRDLDILCRGYDKIFTDLFSQSSLAVIKKAIRKTRLFDVSKEDLITCLSSSKQDREWCEKKAEEILDVFKNSVISKDECNAYVTELHLTLQQYEVIKDQIARVEKTIERFVTANHSNIRTIPGIGPVTAGIIISEIGDIHRFKRPEQIVAFAGLDPSVYESGRSKRIGHISKRGPPILRSALYQAAFIGARSNPVLAEYYSRLKGKGKHHNVCVIAVARKLLLIIYSVWKNNKEFYVPERIDKSSISS